MRNTNELKWYESMDALFGQNLSDGQVEIWQAYLRSANASGDELKASIEMAANETMKGEGVYGRVTVRDLMKWLKIYRKRSILERDKGNRDGMVNQFIEEWRDKIERGCPKDDFINALCVFSNDNGIGISEENEIAGRVIRG